MNLLRWLLDLIYPPKCIICHQIMESGSEPVCPHCMDNLPDHEGADPHVRYADRCVATLFYEGTLRTSFHRFKFRGCRQYAAVYGAWMAHTIEDKLAGKFELLTWAPVSRERRKKRGYDQSMLLCRAISDALGVPMARTLTKETDNPAQSTLTEASMREANVRGVYQPFAPETFQGKRILLIDDIVTTGSTLSECSRVLLTAGAQSVVCAALAAPGKNPEQKGDHL